MTAHRAGAVLGALVRLAPPVLARHYRPDCCIAATRIALDVCDHFGLHAGPVATRAVVHNPVYHRRFREGRGAADEDGLNRLSVEDGSWTIGIGYGPERPGHFAGHLVAGSARNGWLLDLSLTQADRPERGIVLAPLLAPVEGRFFDGCEPYWFGSSNGCAVGYTCVPGETRYTASRDWRDRKRRSPVVAAVIRAVKEAIGG